MSLRSRVKKLEAAMRPTTVCRCKDTQRPYAVYYDDDPQPVVAAITCARCRGSIEPLLIHVCYEEVQVGRPSHRPIRRGGCAPAPD